jgi:SAM-dependent methyltransferase
VTSALASPVPSAASSRAEREARNARLNRTHSMAGMRERGGLVVALVEGRRREVVAAAVRASRPEVVLDVGAEDGWIAQAWARDVGRTVLADLDPAVLARAQARALPRTTVLVADACDGEALRAARPDVVVLSAVLEHLERPAQALAAARAALPRGGRVVAYVPADGPILAIKRALSATGLSRLVPGVSMEPAPGHLHRFTRRSFARLLRVAGRVERVSFDPVALGWVGVARVPPRASG